MVQELKGFRMGEGHSKATQSPIGTGARSVPVPMSCAAARTFAPPEAAPARRQGEVLPAEGESREAEANARRARYAVMRSRGASVLQ